MVSRGLCVKSALLPDLSICVADWFFGPELRAQ